MAKCIAHLLSAVLLLRSQVQVQKKKWIIHSADFQDYIVQFSGMLQGGLSNP